jgi:hypothetical protein
MKQGRFNEYFFLIFLSLPLLFHPGWIKSLTSLSTNMPGIKPVTSPSTQLSGRQICLKTFDYQGILVTLGFTVSNIRIVQQQTTECTSDHLLPEAIIGFHYFLLCIFCCLLLFSSVQGGDNLPKGL